MANADWIPAISDQELNILFARIKPVVDFPDKGGKFYIKDVNLRHIAFTWSAMPTKRAHGLKIIKDIGTYHAYDYCGFFKPSIAEVIAQIPVELRDQVVAFEIVSRPETADDLNKQSEALRAGYHVATTRLYSK